MEEKWETSRQDIRGNYNATSMYGDASIHIHQEKPISSVLPERVWMVPYRQNAFFTGREQLLTNLHTRFMTDQATVLTRGQAITGLGGIGKTQIAVEYAYRYREEYRFVLWVNTATQETLISDIAKIADRLQLPERTLREQEKIVAAVLHWLATQGNWLLIVDNADDLDSIVDFLPTGNSGHLLLTTRQQATGSFEPFPVQQMDQSEGMLLLLRRANLLKPKEDLSLVSLDQQQVAEQVVREMDGLPLALDQAGAYIQETRCSLSDYLAHFRSQRAYLLKRRGRNSSHYPESVATTWSLSFSRVEQQLPVAASVLRLCAFLAPDAIPEEIITAGENSSFLQELATNAVLLDEVISVLSAYSLLLRNRQEKMLSVHRLVQAVLQDAMTREEARGWAEQAISMTETAFPNPTEFAQWSGCERVLPHSLICAIWIQKIQIVSPEAELLLLSAGYYLTERGRYIEAEPILKQALAICEQRVEPEHLDLAGILSVLGVLFNSQGKYSEAELMHQRAVTIRKRRLGPTHILTNLSLNNLALTYKDLGEYAKAETLYQSALAVAERWQDDHGIATILNNLGQLYLTQGKYSEAEPLLERSLTIEERQLGPEHPKIAFPLINLAGIYREQQEYAKAETLYQRALVIQEKQLGPEHPEVIKSLSGLAAIYRDQRKYEEAEPLYVRALEIAEQLGEGHPLIIVCLNNLAGLYVDQMKYKEAEALGQRALTIREKQLGPEHPDVADSLNTLAELSRRQKKYSEAEPLLKRALAIEEQRLGLEHPHVAVVLGVLAGVSQSQGKYAETEAFYRRALAIREQQLGSEHPDTAESLFFLALFYHQQKRHEEAEPLYVRALKIKEQYLGFAHPDLLEILSLLATLYKNQGKYAEAEQLYMQSLKIKELQLGERHLDTTESLDDLADFYRVQGKYASAHLFYQRALVIKEQQLGPEHPRTANSLSKLARLYQEQENYTKAEIFYQRALTIREQQLGPEHPDTAENLFFLAVLYHQQERYEEEEPLLKRSLAICMRVLRQDHPLTKAVRECYTSFFGGGPMKCLRYSPLSSYHLKCWIDGVVINKWVVLFIAPI